MKHIITSIVITITEAFFLFWELWRRGREIKQNKTYFSLLKSERFHIKHSYYQRSPKPRP